MTFESRLFRLYPYDDELANGTVKIIGRQTGNIKNSPVDFTGLLPDGWPYYARVSGELKQIAPTYEQDNYLDSNDNKLQIQDKIIRNYELRVKKAPASILNLFLEGSISLANKIEVTDYNLFNTDIYRDLELYTEEIEYEPVMASRLQTITVKFSDRNQGILKRNF